MERLSACLLASIIVTTFSFEIPVIAQTPSLNSTPPASALPVPEWAYLWEPSFQVPPIDDLPRHVPDSLVTYTLAEIRNLFLTQDWHPEEHPPMPEVVARGRSPAVRACGVCHRADGSGGPENASLAGLPRDYIVQQMADYKSGARTFSGPRRGPVLLMIATATAVTNEEVQAAADYFSALKPNVSISVIETDVVPKTHVARTHFVTSETGGNEPIGQRIVEVPVDAEQFEYRDGRSQFIAYAPTGSLAKGEALAKGSAGTTVACAACHGQDLQGAGTVPRIAGRSPSYVVRQLYDFQQGTRAGIYSALMKPAVEKLTEDDMIALAAYLASLKPETD